MSDYMCNDDTIVTVKESDELFYDLVEMQDNFDNTISYCLFENDGYGNGVMIAKGDSRKRMVNLTLKLGEFVSWGNKSNRLS